MGSNRQYCGLDIALTLIWILTNTLKGIYISHLNTLIIFCFFTHLL